MVDTIRFKGPAAILHGGPRAGRVYYVADLEQERRIAERMDQHYPYTPTGRYEPHPTVDAVSLVVWDHAPEPVKRQRRKASPSDTPAPPPQDIADVCPDCGAATLTVRDLKGGRVDLTPVLTPDGSITVRDGVARRRRQADYVDPDSPGGYSTHRCVPHRLADE